MNCSFNIRYKPKTTRSFTKSDLTVYDSADNTALNALTVYGKSEVVDGAIKSAGEGWSTVDLGTLNWNYVTTFTSPAFNTPISPINAMPYSVDLICSLYQPLLGFMYMENQNMKIATGGSGLNISNFSYTDATAFKAAMSGVLLCYKLADPTQGNAIAIKTDDGSGTNGTMATFATGTPLRGIPDSEVRDVMAWDGSAGTVTKNCGKVRLADLTWDYTDIYGNNTIGFRALAPANLYIDSSISSYPTAISSIYTPITANGQSNFKTNKTFAFHSGYIKIIDNDYTTVSDFIASLGDAELVYELATPTTEQLTTTENDSIAALRTFEPQTHAQNNAQTEMTVDYTIEVPTI